MKLKLHLLAASLLAASAVLPSLASDTLVSWNQNCVRCHGADGKGQTKMGRKLKIKDLTSAVSKTRLTEERIMETIAEGKQDSSGNERMPAYREKISEADRQALTAYVRSLSHNANVANSE